MFDTSKAIQESDNPVEIIKENGDFFSEIISKYFSESLGKFPNCLKLANITLVVKKGFTYLKKITVDQPAFF